MESLPSEVDVIIVGTGVSETMLAAALAVAGRRVLQLDPAAHYGGVHATFSLSALNDWLKGRAPALHGWAGDGSAEGDRVLAAPATAPTATDGLDDRKCIVCPPEPLALAPRPSGARTFAGAELARVLGIPVEEAEAAGEAINEREPASAAAEAASPHAPAAGAEGASEGKAGADGGEASWAPVPAWLRALSSRFSLDVSPRLLLAQGPLIDKLRTSPVAQYVEFLPLNGMLVLADAPAPAPARSAPAPLGRGGNAGAPAEGGGPGEAPLALLLRPVPLSRADIFGASDLPLEQKRRLMRALQSLFAWANVPTLGSAAAPTGASEAASAAAVAAAAAASAGAPPPAGSTPALPAPSASGAPAGSLADALDELGLARGPASAVAYALAMAVTEQWRPAGGAAAEDGAARGEAESPARLRLADGALAVASHVQGLRRYGSTALLVPIHGCSEFAQGYARQCAVHGGLLALAHSPRAVHVRRATAREAGGGGAQDGEGGGAAPSGRWVEAVEMADGQLVRTGALVLGAHAEAALAGAAGAAERQLPPQPQPPAVEPGSRVSRVGRCILLLTAPVQTAARRQRPQQGEEEAANEAEDEEEGDAENSAATANGAYRQQQHGHRCLTVVPPRTVRYPDRRSNPHPVHCLLLDADTGATAQLPRRPAAGGAGGGAGRCLLALHLTSLLDGSDGEAADLLHVAAALLQRAAVLTDAQRGASAFPPAQCSAVWAATFELSVSHAAGSAPAGGGPAGGGYGVRQSSLGANCTVLTPQLHALTLDGALADAQLAFERLCPSEPFLPPPAEPAPRPLDADADDDIGV